MEVTVLSIRLLKSMLLLAVQVYLSYSHDGGGFPQVVPNQQQHFQYEPIVVSCEGLNGMTRWRVMKKIKGDVQPCASTWETSVGPCKISNGFPSSDSGEYWCEMGGIQRSPVVNITVTPSVLLEIPPYPVTEGNEVTLHCKKKQKTSSLTAEFYKNGILIGKSLTEAITNLTVSKSDEGLYKCSFTDVGESPESWLSVKVYTQGEEPPQFTHHLAGPTVLRVSLLVVLLLLVGLLQCWKNKSIITGQCELIPN